MPRNSYIFKLFAILCIVLIVVAILMNGLIYNYSKDRISDEIIELNKVVLNQISETISLSLEDMFNLSNRIAYDNLIIDTLKYNDYNDYLDSYMENITTNYLWSRNRQKNLFQLTIVGYNGINYGDLPNSYKMEDLREKTIYSELISESGEPQLINTIFDNEKQGIYRYSFQIVKEIRDHITDEPYGMVILNVSENSIYHSYNDLNNKNKRVFIVDDSGAIVSHRDKRLIKSNYFDELDMEYRLETQSGHIEPEIIKGDKLVLFSRLNASNWYVIEEIQGDQISNPVGTIRYFILIVTIICILIFMIVSIYFAFKTSQPIMKIRKKMELVTQGDLSVRAELENNDEFGQIAKSFNEMVEQIESLLVKVKEEEHRKRLAELDFLRTQINPHFIYNTLSSIRFYVEMNKNKEAENMLYLFSKILRKTLTRSDQFTSIKDEINITKDYIELQKLRYTDNFTVIYHISDEILDFMIPNFILQPIVENSIFYGVSQQEKGLITISGDLVEDEIKIIISDNGPGMDKEDIDKIFDREPKTNKVGLINVNERIQLNYGNQYGLEITSEIGEGTSVTLTIPAQR